MPDVGRRQLGVPEGRTDGPLSPLALGVRGDQVIPGTQNIEQLDDAAAVQKLDIVRGEPRKASFTAAVNDSFGFGGHNIALAFTTP